MTELGRRVGLSSPAVAERVRRLEESGVIRGYRLEIDPAALGLPLSAYIRVSPDATQHGNMVVMDIARERQETGAIPDGTIVSVKQGR